MLKSPMCQPAALFLTGAAAALPCIVGRSTVAYITGCFGTACPVVVCESLSSLSNSPLPRLVSSPLPPSPNLVLLAAVDTPDNDLWLAFVVPKRDLGLDMTASFRIVHDSEATSGTARLGDLFSTVGNRESGSQCQAVGCQRDATLHNMRKR
ncbi:hypothetical protein EDD17DRAFT_1894061 [Pisolithus thermaeus]|nr:hypothetical protein EDD17DRAFT_1894061 [Pisolithus thermaeus]